MSEKQAVLEIIRDMSEEATCEEVLEEIQIFASLKRGEKEIAEGKGVSHEEVVRKVASWITELNSNSSGLPRP